MLALRGPDKICPQAGQNLSTGRMWPSGRSLETPALDGGP